MPYTTVFVKKKKKKWKPNPFLIQYNAIPVGEPFSPTINEKQFFEMAGWFLAYPSTEIAGVAVYDEESNGIVWTEMATIEGHSQGHVESDTGSAIASAIAAGFGVPNVQWHSHPNMGTFFSVTDTDDQMKYILDAQLLSERGFTIFLVFDQLSWRVVRIDWDKDVLTKRSGYVTCGGIELKPAPFQRHAYGYRKWDSPWGTTATTYHQRAKGPQPLGEAEYDFSEDALHENVVEWLQIADPEDIPDWELGMYIGNWSDEPEDYRRIFEIFGVVPFHWAILFETINDIYKYNRYYTIIERPHTWENLINDAANESTFETGGDYPQSL